MGLSLFRCSADCDGAAGWPHRVGRRSRCDPAALRIAALVLQVGAILLVFRLAEGLLRKIRQPQMSGEMVAGILLGPLLLGWARPGVSLAQFRAENLSDIRSLRQIGLILIMFLVIFSLDPKELRGRGQTALLASNAASLTMCALGVSGRFTSIRGWLPADSVSRISPCLMARR